MPAEGKIFNSFCAANQCFMQINVFFQNIEIYFLIFYGIQTISGVIPNRQDTGKGIRRYLFRYPDRCGKVVVRHESKNGILQHG